MAEYSTEYILNELDNLKKSMEGLDDEVIPALEKIRTYILIQAKQLAFYTWESLTLNAPAGIYSRKGSTSGSRFIVVRNNSRERNVLHLSEDHEVLETAVTNIWKDSLFLREENRSLLVKYTPYSIGADDTDYTFGELMSDVPHGLYICKESISEVRFLVIGGRPRVLLYIYHSGVIEVASTGRWKDSLFVRDTERKLQLSLSPSIG